MAFPFPESSPSLEIPDSPRKRRRVIRGSEETEGDMTIENYLYKSDPYCSTSLPHPLPFPLMMEHAPYLEHRIAPLRDEIRRILQRHGFPSTAGFIPYVATKPHYPGGDVLKNLLCVVLTPDGHTPSRLGAAKDELLELLRRHGIDDMHVDIRNVGLYFRPSLFAISPHHPVVKANEQAKNQIITILMKIFSLSGRFFVSLMLVVMKTRPCPLLLSWSNL